MASVLIAALGALVLALLAGEKRVEPPGRRAQR
jgi:hypothetical protein